MPAMLNKAGDPAISVRTSSHLQQTQWLTGERACCCPRGMKGVADRAGGMIGGHMGFAMQARELPKLKDRITPQVNFFQ